MRLQNASQVTRLWSEFTSPLYMQINMNVIVVCKESVLFLLASVCVWEQERERGGGERDQDGADWIK